MTAFVYLLVHQNFQRFKIGKAVDIPARVAQIRLDKLDFIRSSALEVKDGKIADNLERALHRCFAKWRLPPEIVSEQDGAKFDGHTEWFSIDCLDRVVSFVEHNADLLECRRVVSDEFARLFKLPQPVERVLQSASSERKRSRKMVSVEDGIRDAVAQVNGSLPQILKVLSYCHHTIRKTSGSGNVIVGKVSEQYVEVFREEIADLMYDSHIKVPNIMFGVFGGFSCLSQNSGDLHFELSTIWLGDSLKPDAPNWRHPVYDAACLALSKLPLPVQGWSEMDSYASSEI